MAVLDTVYHPKAPRVVEEDSPLKLSSHDMWCEFTWGHVALTLKEWLRHLIGLQVYIYKVIITYVCNGCSCRSFIRAYNSYWYVQELESTFGEVCKRLQLVADSDGNSGEESGDDDPLQPRELCLSSGDMAGLLRHWLLEKTSMKVCLLVDLVHHALHAQSSLL